jgi:hypothetical protein
MKNKNFIIVKDLRFAEQERIFIDFSDTMIRNFEEIIKTSDNKEELKKEFPNAIDLTNDELSGILV